MHNHSKPGVTFIPVVELSHQFRVSAATCSIAMNFPKLEQEGHPQEHPDRLYENPIPPSPLSSKMKPRFKTQLSWNEQKFGHRVRRGSIPRMTVLAMSSSKLLH
jgi:hypothetical protein